MAAATLDYVGEQYSMTGAGDPYTLTMPLGTSRSSSPTGCRNISSGPLTVTLVAATGEFFWDTPTQAQVASTEVTLFPDDAALFVYRDGYGWVYYNGNSSGGGGVDYLIEVAKGSFPGQSLLRKFGVATVGTTWNPVTLSGVYTMPTSAVALEFVSDDAGDTAAGAGAREITVIGLDANWDEVTQVISTNGTTAVAIPTSLIRLYHWYVSASGTYGDFATGSHFGNMTIRVSGGGATWSQITDNSLAFGQSQICCYTLPRNKTAYLLSTYSVVDSTKAVDVVYSVREGADDVTSPFSSMRVLNGFTGVIEKFETNIRSTGAPIVGPADFGLIAKITSGTAEMSAAFELLIIDD